MRRFFVWVVVAKAVRSTFRIARSEVAVHFVFHAVSRLVLTAKTSPGPRCIVELAIGGFGRFRSFCIINGPCVPRSYGAPRFHPIPASALLRRFYGVRLEREKANIAIGAFFLIQEIPASDGNPDDQNAQKLDIFHDGNPQREGWWG